MDIINRRQNLLESIRFGNPVYVPRTDEGIITSIQFEGNFRMADWVDLWGVRWKIGVADAVPFPKGNPLTSLDKLDRFRIPAPEELVLSDEVRRRFDAAKTSGKLVFGGLTYFLFERAWALMGMEEFLMALATHPEQVKRLLRIIADFNIAVFQRYLDLGVDGVEFSEDLGSQKALLMSPEMFREFFLPEYRRCFEPVLAAGKMINFHSCGCIQDIVEDLASIGVTILNPIQARANDLAKIKRKTVGEMALMGAIDSHLLMTGNNDTIRAEVKRVIDILAPGGGYIIGLDQGMPYPRDNLISLWKAAEEYGRY
ncbi:MAG: hypothetical protein GX369_08420 [Euryarchaeota archaeon]|nr:hypothetical protein [Euryarchaeota archaeon]